MDSLTGSNGFRGRRWRVPLRQDADLWLAKTNLTDLPEPQRVCHSQQTGTARGSASPASSLQMRTRICDLLGKRANRKARVVTFSHRRIHKVKSFARMLGSSPVSAAKAEAFGLTQQRP